MNKTACDIINESFEKVAALNLGGIASAIGKGAKSMATATKNLPNSLNNAKRLNTFAKNTNLSESTRNIAGIARNKQLGNAAKGMILPGAGIMGASAIGAGINKSINNNQQKTAFDIVNESFEKVAEARWQKEMRKLVSSGASRDKIRSFSNKLKGTPTHGKELADNLSRYSESVRAGFAKGLPNRSGYDYKLDGVLEATRSALKDTHGVRSIGMNEHFIKRRGLNEFSNKIRKAKGPKTKQRAIQEYRDMMSNGGIENVPKIKRQLAASNKQR